MIEEKNFDLEKEKFDRKDAKELIYNIIDSFYSFPKYIEKHIQEVEFVENTKKKSQESSQDGKVNVNINSKDVNIVKINFVDVLRQHNLNLCGIHSLFNAIYFLDFYKAKIIEEENLIRNNYINSTVYLKEMKNNVFFWRFHKYCVDEIISIPNISDEYIKSIVNDGPIERFMLDYMIKNSNMISNAFSNVFYTNLNNMFLKIFFFKELYNNCKLKSKNSKIDLQSLYKSFYVDKNLHEEINLKKELFISYEYIFFCYETFQNSNKQTIYDLEVKISEFNSSKKNYNLLVLIMGITNHWSVLILEKSKIGHFKTNYYYLDSKMITQIFSFNNETKLIDEFIIKRELNKQRYNIKLNSEWKNNLLKQWFKDVHMIVSIVNGIVDGRVSLKKIIYENNLENQIIEFELRMGVDIRGYNQKTLKNKSINQLKLKGKMFLKLRL